VSAIDTRLAVGKLGFEAAPDEVRNKKFVSSLLLHVVFFLRCFRENINFLEYIVLKLQKDQISPSTTESGFEFLTLPGASEDSHDSNVFCNLFCMCMYVYHHSL